MLDTGNIQRLSIEGPVVLKRRTHWVKRHATLADCIFSYKNLASDKKPKYSADLRKAKVMLGQQDSNRAYIYI